MPYKKLIKYDVALRSGKDMTLTRYESEDKSATALVVWASNQAREVFVDFSEGVIRASDISFISKGEEVDNKEDELSAYEQMMEDEWDEWWESQIKTSLD